MSDPCDKTWRAAKAAYEAAQLDAGISPWGGSSWEYQREGCHKYWVAVVEAVQAVLDEPDEPITVNTTKE